MSLDDKSTKQVAEENGTEWIKFWDSTQHKNYYLNMVTNETSWEVPEDFDDSVPAAKIKLPVRLQIMLKLQAWLRGKRIRNAKF